MDSTNNSNSTSVSLTDLFDEKIKEKESCNYNFNENIDCTEDLYTNECNKFLLKKEIVERNCLKENENEDLFLYPNLNDSKFNIKIASKKEFNDTQYDGKIYKDIRKHADELAVMEPELQPHQAFVKNFLSSETPYNSLLLYHGLGSGKTCCAIGVCEEMRDYMKLIGQTKRIIFVASENIQENFKIQLFDERKLKFENGIWTIKSCIGDKLLKEINPTNLKEIPREKVISQIKQLINTSYLFLGYEQFANYIIKIMNANPNVENQKVKKRLKNEFDNRLIVIDEVHNIRKTNDNSNKKVATNLDILVKNADNMRFLLLSATPMYNTYQEIIWLINLMNINDRRSKINVKDIFDKYGHFKPKGKQLFIQKVTGYISFVRGENPYLFPYRVYPKDFAPKKTFPYISYPEYQMNMKKIKDENKNRILSLYLNQIGNCNDCGFCQACVYKYIMNELRIKEYSYYQKKTGKRMSMPTFENMESFGYAVLQTPLTSLIISYPTDGLKDYLINIPKANVNNMQFEEISSESLGSDIDESDISLSDPNENDLIQINIDENEENEEAEEDEEAEEAEKNILKEKDFISNVKITSVGQTKPTLLIDESSSEIKTDQSGGNDSDESSSIEERRFLIDPKELTGKLGLKRMMDFQDTASPPVKGNFEYKTNTINQYGKIFSYDKIGSFSTKIKNILKSIYNPETNIVSEGIILIYSQYIDGGLIPMALALEEMGFVRYGNNTKNLFKTKPSVTIDSRTMKPPIDTKNFLPAKYSLITGDKKLSPDTAYEVKGLTHDSNINGDKVKVVLISKAGAEGIDFKNIRQVHILDPWYTMNRIEQIIGRAVRNLSHKALEFEKRNVEIYLYGTILDDNKEETADLYVYRVAELKAIQIGKVSRVIKQTAVDCLLNHEQLNFTQEKMAQVIDQPIKQILSNGIKLDNFKIGDAPYSSACDYMASCNFDCSPNEKITDINEDSYNDNFVMMNKDKIVQKIKLLMREEFFYKKNVLIKSIQTKKQYPLVQIYAALSYLIDQNEPIQDKYGRSGKLINIDEYYLFQPDELTNKNSSIFERSVPIDYKHQLIDLNLESQKKRENKIKLEKELDFDISENKLFKQLLNDFDATKEYLNMRSVSRGDDDWYKHCGIAIQRLYKDVPKMKSYLFSFLVAHMLDQLLFDEKLFLLNLVYSQSDFKSNSLELLIKEYFENLIVSTQKYKCILMFQLNKLKMMILNDGKWIEAEPEQLREIAADDNMKKYLEFNSKNYNKYVGFLGYKKNNTVIVFKTKDMDSKRDSGATCEESGKDKSIKKLNLILGLEKYNKENTRLLKDSSGKLLQEPIGQVELCILQEFYLRYFDEIKKNNVKWFLTPEMAIYHQLYKVIT